MEKNNIYHLTFFIPAPVWEMFQKRVRDYRFKSTGCVVYYLLESYSKQNEGIKISPIMKRILQSASENWFNLFRYDERSQTAITVDRSWAEKMAVIAMQSGYKDRSRLVAVLIGALVSSPGSLIKKMSQEMDKREVDTKPCIGILSTYISYYQYAVLGIVAKRQKVTIPSLLRTVLDVIIISENENSDISITGDMRDLINDVLTIKGYTVKDFRREKAIRLSISSDRRMTILHLMKKYDIPTSNEFMRRLVLFFLNAQYIIFKEGDNYLTRNTPNKGSENEYAIYDEYVKNDFKYTHLTRL